MAARTVVGETARYNRLDSQDPDLDSNSSIPVQPPPTSSDTQSFAASSTSATPSIVRRHHREPVPLHLPIRAMSLVGLKNIFFRQIVTPISAPHRSDSSQSSILGSSEGDVESQDSKAEKVNGKKGFKVDARVISDATIGLSDGLTVPFALTAGLSALGNTKVVIYGGFAELIAGAISMGLGGYLGAKSEA
jgi:hypothetical protein